MDAFLSAFLRATTKERSMDVIGTLGVISQRFVVITKISGSPVQLKRCGYNANPVTYHSCGNNFFLTSIQSMKSICVNSKCE